MAMPKEMELLDLEQFDSGGKGGKSPSRKFQKKKHASKRSTADSEVISRAGTIRKEKKTTLLQC